jgi:hypothetical protein
MAFMEFHSGGAEFRRADHKERAGPRQVRATFVAEIALNRV